MTLADDGFTTTPDTIPMRAVDPRLAETVLRRGAVVVEDGVLRRRRLGTPDSAESRTRDYADRNAFG